MKKGVHPEAFEVTASCVCGSSFQTSSTEQRIEVDICSQCHPLFTGSQKFVDARGRIERFKRRYSKKEDK